MIYFKKNQMGFKSLVATTGMAAFICGSASVSAADIIEEIIVTAQKRVESVNDVPITISAFTDERLQELGVVDARDLGKIVPGFKYSATGLNKPIFTLRGVGFNDFSQTASGTVGLYIGEFNLPYPIMAKGPAVDIERVEVLKGPQGTLYGRNTTGGVVNFIPATPTPEFAAGFKAGYSRFETYDVEAYASGPVTDTVGMRFAARTIQSNEGWQNSLTRPGDTIGEKDKWSARYTVDWAPTEKLAVSFAVDYWQDKSDPQAAQPIAIEAINPILGDLALSPLVATHPLVPMNTDDNRIADWPPESWGYKWQFNDTFYITRMRVDWDVFDVSTLSYLVSYADFETDQGTMPNSGLSVPNGEALMDVDTTAVTHELRLAGALRENFDYIVGAFVSEDEVSQHWVGIANTLSVLFPEPITGESPIATSIISLANQEAEVAAVFADVAWHFRPDVSLTVGARYTDETRKFKGCTADDPNADGSGFYNVINTISITQKGGVGGAGPGDCVTLDSVTGNPGLVVDKLDEDNLSGRIVLDWTPADGLLFYLSRSRGFKSGSFPISQASDSAQYRPAKQEQLDAWEVGGKLSVFAQSTQLNFALFDYDYRDKQLLSFIYDNVFGALPQLANAPRSEVQGAEIDFRSRPISGLDLFVGASYIETEIKKFISINQSGNLEDYSGREFNNAPQLTGSAGFRYTWDLPWSDSFDLMFGMDYSYTDETSAVFNEDPRYEIKDFDNINVQLGLESVDGNWKVTAWGRNITNEYQMISVGMLAVDAIQRYTQMPATYGITFQYDYGG